MVEIYEQVFHDSFAGRGVESALVVEGEIVAQARGYDNPAVIDNFEPQHIGQPASSLVGWHQLEGFELENAQGWAEDIIQG
jgi:hypothetical protein